jgi:hypothetical protein
MNTAPPKAPRLGTVKRLFAVSENRCAFPKCKAELVCQGTVVGKICHIKADKPNGPRYDAGQSDEERHGFDNLILMCGTHHTVIDDDEEAYTVQRLTDMKTAHEASAANMSDDQASHGATLLLSYNQSGGITAQSVHAHTINLHSPAVPTTDAAQAAAARGYFAPELARILGRQIQILDRAVVNFICTSTRTPRPGDSWASLKPSQPILYPDAAEFQNLSTADATALIEFYDSLQGIAETVNGWIDSQSMEDVNGWNVLMQSVQHNLTLGQIAVQRFCPDKPFSPIMPASGTLFERAERSKSGAQQALKAHLARHGVA